MAERPRSTGERLGDFVRTHREAIIAKWKQRAAQLRPARGLPDPILIDHVPELLTFIAETALAGSEDAPSARPLREVPIHHAFDRLAHGYDIKDVVKEYAALRCVILDLWETGRAGNGRETSGELSRLNEAIDDAVASSISRFQAMRVRLLHVLDRLSTVSVAGQDLGALLTTLIAAAQETTAAVDAALILLRDERGALRVNAAVGLDEEPLRGLMFQATEELAEAIAARRVACSLDALPPLDGVSRELHARGMGAAVHGVPLIHDEQVVGVAIMGSRRTAVFSEEEKLLFHLVTSRALALIVQAQLMSQERAARREAERTGRAQRFLAAASAALSDSLDKEGTLGRIGRITVPELADYCAVEVQGEDVEALRLVAVTHADPEKAERARALFRELRSTLPLAALIREVMRSERPQLFGDLRRAATEGERAATKGERAALPLEGERAALEGEHGRAALEGERAELEGERGRAALEGERAARPQEDERERLLELIRKLGLRSAMLLPMVARGRAFGYIALATAESGRLYDEADLAMAHDLARRAALAVDNARLYEAAQRAIALRDNVLATVSHDLRNPLSAILAATAVLGKRAAEASAGGAEGPGGAEGSGGAGGAEGPGGSAKAIQAIERSAHRMDRLIHDLLDFASLRAGRLALRRRRHDPREIVKEALETFEPAAHEKGVRLSASSGEEVPELGCDRDRVLQVLSNLLSNAVKVTQAPGAIMVRCERVGDDVAFSVTDTGPGIPESERQHIFERFFRGERNSYKGTGLGLAIAKELVIAHGGEIRVESTMGVGSTFTFTIPVAGGGSDDDGSG